MKERPVLPSSESFTTRQDLQGKFSFAKKTKEIILKCLHICQCKQCAQKAKDAGTSDCWVKTLRIWRTGQGGTIIFTAYHFDLCTLLNK